MHEISGHKVGRQPAPTPRQTLVRRSGGGGERAGGHETILKRNTGAYGWQAADI